MLDGMDVTAVVPSIPPRGDRLFRAVRSVLDQTVPAAAVSIALDVDHDGAGPTRTRALAAAVTTWVAFLDDDDVWRPYHLEHLLAVAAETDADVVVPWFEVIGGGDPFPANRGRITNDEGHLCSFPITCLVRTDVARRADFGAHHGEDYTYWNALRDSGANMVATERITWDWLHWGGNTSGRPDRW